MQSLTFAKQMVVCVVCVADNSGLGHDSTGARQHNGVQCCTLHTLPTDRQQIKGAKQWALEQLNAQTEVCLTRETTLLHFVFTEHFYHC